MALKIISSARSAVRQFLHLNLTQFCCGWAPWANYWGLAAGFPSFTLLTPPKSGLLDRKEMIQSYTTLDQ